MEARGNSNRKKSARGCPVFGRWLICFWTTPCRCRLCRPGDIALSTSLSYAQPGGHCTIDIVGVFARVTCSSETQTDRPRWADRDKRFKTDGPRQIARQTDRDRLDRPRPRQAKTETDRDRQTDRVRQTETDRPRPSEKAGD